VHGGLQQKEIMSKITNLEEAFIEQLKDIYSAENQLIKALPKMAKAANNPELKNGFEEHLAQTKVHAQRLEQIADGLGEKATGKKCLAMEGLVKEGAETMEEDAVPAVLDSMLIAAAQRVEHYEIAAYGTACKWAELLGNEEAVELLSETLQEEKDTDEKLSAAAEAINSEANDSESEEEDTRSV
jgi:ferritin-like metal-binding protein YciE